MNWKNALLIIDDWSFSNDHFYLKKIYVYSNGVGD